MGWFGEKWGKNRMFLALAAPFTATFSPAIPPHPLVFFPFQSVLQAEFITKTRRFRPKSKPFGRESSPAQGRKEGNIRGEIGHFPFEESP